MPLRQSTATATRPMQSSERVLLKDVAYEEIKRLIQNGFYSPSSSVSEKRLVEKLGMSKTPIRAALENLETQGLVSVSPQRGISICELSARSIGELFDVRHAIEPYIVEQLAKRSLNKSQSDDLKRNIREQWKSAKKEDALSATRLDIEFHRMLAQFLDNVEMSKWLESCFDKLHRSVLRINQLSPGRLTRSTQEHEEIVDALIKVDCDLASTRMLAHLRYGRQFLMGVES